MPMLPAGCTECQNPMAAVSLDEQVLCDRCADRRLASITGWPELPTPPAPEIVVGPDGRRHTTIYRIMRWPGGITARAEELGLGLDAGYRIDLTVDHRADPGELLARLRRTLQWQIAHPYLEPDDWYGWGLVKHETAGRLREDDKSDLPRVVIDGHSLSWEDYGRLLKSYVGWSFHLRLGVDPAASKGTAGLAHTRPASADDLAGTAGDMTWFVIDSSHYSASDQWQSPNRRGDS
ncbi:MAG: DUF7713 domain-containing protein [Candidatus Dormibacteria bacterium]